MAGKDWFGRPVFHVKDVDASIRFYTDRLGFTSEWRYAEDGKGHVAQVEGLGCTIILADTWPDKVGKGVMFISLNAENNEAQTAGLDALRADLEAKGVAVKDGSWGYRLLVVDDLDGNQLFFNYPSETA